MLECANVDETNFPSMEYTDTLSLSFKPLIRKKPLSEVMMTGLLRTALCVYDKAVRFEASGVQQYERESK